MDFDEYGNPIYPEGVTIHNPNMGYPASQGYGGSVGLASLNNLTPGPWASGYVMPASVATPNSLKAFDILTSNAAGLTDWQSRMDYLEKLRNPSFKDMSIGQKFGLVGSGLNALSQLTSAYNGFKNLSLAKKQFNTQNQYAAVNLANQAKTANQALEENIRSRYAGGQTAAEAEELAKYRLQGTVGGKG